MTAVSVLGAGAWGTALAAHAARSHDVRLWGRDAGELASIEAQRENARYLPGVVLPAALHIEEDLSAALMHAAQPDGLLVIATPVSGLREMAAAWLEHTGASGPARMVWLCKGIEPDSGALPHQMVQHAIASHGTAEAHCGVLSGPSFAREVGQGLPCALTVASQDAVVRERVQQVFHHHAMRIYASDDIIGVEVGGAVKNVLAIATGASDGLGLGLNARAALVTRGLAEMTRLGIALGGRAETFMGLTGVGDLILTATGDLSRNRTVGMRLAQGRELDDILRELGHVAEGVRCARAVLSLAQLKGVDMPITEAVCEVLFKGLPVQTAVERLLQRDARAE
jgi:glycerol-3-phosphate dehydrogenase (NAD(P)+)